ncbi:beta-galactosidase [Agromyces sp. Root81]|uniref:glycoside hydrolase family 2 TIM barrel-domain containing protein n=1 Tax=Agromyces sp. Root81 TaxID=1736601 RepID=UPI0007010067|nr:glycoside hydrolase family 2 TIM barrel-domain containing protein [Agromyces sp. Root81]KRC61466.1 beta-galactosidase [Agromyces sp. Root81]
MNHYVYDPSSGAGLRRPARSWVQTDAPTRSLNGEWDFRLLAGAPGLPGTSEVLALHESPESFAAPDYDASEWQRLIVPGHWVLTEDLRHGHPIYTNAQFPFPIEPPFVPDANPTGDYRREFDIPREWATMAGIVLRFDGVESRYRVWVNGSEVGIASGSRLMQEFDVTALVRPGLNTIAVRVHQWSAATYLEDQDQWWLPGIFRDVTLIARPPGAIEDVWLRTGFDRGVGTIDPEIVAPADAFPMTFEISELGVRATWLAPADVGPIEVDAVEPWSAECPRLYNAVIQAVGERAELRIGFRTIRIDGDQLLVNGERVVFHGVNRHETHPDRGRVFDEEWVRADLLMMKAFNVNAFRTSHYPPHPRVLDLADELGFWVMLENDFETHGFATGEWAENPAEHHLWRDACLDRIVRTVERDKNHPSIIMWSLGNESGTGQNLAEMSAWVHDRDPERPVHYEGDHVGAYTDVYSLMYSSLVETEAVVRHDATSLLMDCSPAESARQRSKPFLLCEYAHAMGNGPGGLDQYEELAWSHPRYHGGFIWEWRDHGLRRRDADGREFFAYGGDFGEIYHDGNFVLDGLVRSDDVPSPALHEFAQVSAPVRVELSRHDDGVAVSVVNRRHSTDTSDLVFVWRLERDGELVAEGVLDLPAVGPGERTEGRLDLEAARFSGTAGELWLTVEAVTADDREWAPAGHVVMFAQVDVTVTAPPLRAPRAQAPAAIERGEVPATTVLGDAEFHYGRLVSIAGRRIDGPTLQLWRAPTDNDRREMFGSYDIDAPTFGDRMGVMAAPHADDWAGARLDHLSMRVIDAAGIADGLSVLRRWGGPDRRTGGTIRETWRLLDAELWLRIDIAPSAGWKILWPRIGVRFDLERDVDRATWFGTGPRESYPDSRQAARVGRFSAGIDELGFEYSRPQENGHRSELRTLELGAGERPWLRLDAAADSSGRLPGFTLSRYTAEVLAGAAHPHELPPSTANHLYIDAAQNGLGSRACGPDVWPDAMLRPEARSLALRLSAP